MKNREKICAISEHDNIFSDLTWYCYHGIEVRDSNPKSGLISRDRKLCDALQIMKGYVQWGMVCIHNRHLSRGWCGILWYRVRGYIPRAHCEVQYGVNVLEYLQHFRKPQIEHLFNQQFWCLCAWILWALFYWSSDLSFPLSFIFLTRWLTSFSSTLN